MQKKLNEIFEKFKGDKRVVLIVALGVLGLILLFLSEVLPDSKTNENTEDMPQTQSVYEYESDLEDRLEEMLRNVEGAGNVCVMLMLDCGDESVYATENKSGTNTDEKKYVLVENDGQDEGLLLKTAQPQVRGVGVVCEGADIPKVKQEITGLLTAVLGVSANRVNIAKMKSGNGG